MTTAAPTAIPASKPWALWTGRVLSGLVVLALVASASMKLRQPPEVVEGFAKSGFPASVLLPIGVVELLSALLYAVPRTAVLGAILVTGYLGGATVTHVRQGDSFLVPVLLGVIAWGGLFLRDARVRALLPLRGTN
ncbi:DoxX family protein [Myxococcus sp. K38C18041901]|uniref:DoxX family protein n=1 Tax=Myxococcus guangdongensis TaxID=2906760 RepID=UPI0020A6E13C|nr:DoxX family protein [Myxococcus guangdongensis]MCP3058353.1 DoxX family protein [Myxococcus guangdongensis]